MTADQPVFQEPWEARAFALVVALHERGLYTWREWSDALTTRIAANSTDVQTYRQWVGALEDLLAAKGLSSIDEILTWRTAWRNAIRRTPHGEPIELNKRDFD
jgi:nitrile hydratase accessory protein